MRVSRVYEALQIIKELLGRLGVYASIAAVMEFVEPQSSRMNEDMCTVAVGADFFNICF